MRCGIYPKSTENGLSATHCWLKVNASRDRQVSGGTPGTGEPALSGPLLASLI